MDSIRVSEAPDTGSIPVEATFKYLENPNPLSFYFSITTTKRISYNNLLIELRSKDIEINQPEILQNLIADDGCKLFIPHRSTRGVSLRYDDETYSVGLNIVASESDVELALDITEALSIYTQSLILPEDKEESIDIETFRKEYGQEWINQIKTLGINLFIEKIGGEGNVLSISCCYMTYVVGPKIHSQLDSSSKEAYYNGLVRLICKTQFFNREKYITPSVLVVTKKDTNKKEEMIVLYPHGCQFLPTVDVLAIRSGKDWVELPFARINEIATSKFTLIDEQQYLVEELSDAEYESIFIEAKHILGGVSNKTSGDKPIEASNAKKWWRFW